MVISDENIQLETKIHNYIKESPIPVSKKDIMNIASISDNTTRSIIRGLIYNEQILKIEKSKDEYKYCTVDRLNEFKEYHIAPETNFKYIKKSTI